MDELKKEILDICIPSEKAFKVINDEKMHAIAERMPEINRAMAAFGKTNSQTAGTLMTLSMMTAGPYRVLRQILAELNRKVSALKEAYFDLQEKKITAQMEIATSEKAEDPLERELHAVRAARMESQISDAVLYVEAALKSIGMYQDAYDEIRKAHNIPEKWDEKDFERAEVEHHIRTAYRLAIRDVHMTGRLNVATCEYMEQFGISPVQGNIDVDLYMQRANEIQRSGKEVSVTLLHDFLDQMVEKHRDKWQLAAARLGLKSPMFERWLYTEGD